MAVMLPIHARVHGFESQHYSPFLLPVNALLRRQQVTAPVLGSLPPRHETQIEFLTSAWPQLCLLQGIQGAEPEDGRSPSLCLANKWLLKDVQSWLGGKGMIVWDTIPRYKVDHIILPKQSKDASGGLYLTGTSPAKFRKRQQSQEKHSLVLNQRFQTIQGVLQGQQDSTTTGKELQGEGRVAPLQPMAWRKNTIMQCGSDTAASPGDCSRGTGCAGLRILMWKSWGNDKVSNEC